MDWSSLFGGGGAKAGGSSDGGAGGRSPASSASSAAANQFGSNNAGADTNALPYIVLGVAGLFGFVVILFIVSSLTRKS